MTSTDKKDVFFDHVQSVTEKFLTCRRRIKREKREKRAQKSQIRDWLEAFLWAACMVLLINQYFIQAYRIPSGSMIDTLNIGDHIFVNKLVYGPELLPGVLKLPSPVRPKRNDIIIFENPSYISRGPVFDIAQRIIYMLTLSIVDIDKDETGEPRVHFLIKRAAAMGGDHVVSENGNVKIRFAGEEEWVYEKDYNKARGWNHRITRLVQADDYPLIEDVGRAYAWADMRLALPQSLIAKTAGANNLKSFDFSASEQARLEMLRKLSPGDTRYAALWAQRDLGRYVPHGRILPLGDNRDNSRDGREFGPVRLSKVLGKGMVIYWPLTRAGRIK